MSHFLLLAFTPDHVNPLNPLSNQVRQNAPPVLPATLSGAPAVACRDPRFRQTRGAKKAVIQPGVQSAKTMNLILSHQIIIKFFR